MSWKKLEDIAGETLISVDTPETQFILIIGINIIRIIKKKKDTL